MWYHQFSSVAQLCATLCDPMDFSTAGFPVLHHLPELTQTYVHWVSDAIQPSHPVILFSSCPQFSPASGSFPKNGLFASGSQSIGASASVLQMNTQGWFPLGLTGSISLLFKGLWRVFSNTMGSKAWVFSPLSLISNSHIHTWCTWLLEKPKLWLHRPLSEKRCLCFLTLCLDLSKLFFQGAGIF